MTEERKTLSPGDPLPPDWVWVRRKVDDEIMALYGPNYNFETVNRNDFELLDKFNVADEVVEHKADGTVEEIEVVIPEPGEFQEETPMP